jgi:hypothetical protein
MAAAADVEYMYAAVQLAYDAPDLLSGSPGEVYQETSHEGAEYAAGATAAVPAVALAVVSAVAPAPLLCLID